MLPVCLIKRHGAGYLPFSWPLWAVSCPCARQSGNTDDRGGSRFAKTGDPSRHDQAPDAYWLVVCRALGRDNGGDAVRVPAAQNIAGGMATGTVAGTALAMLVGGGLLSQYRVRLIRELQTGTKPVA